MTRRWFRNLPVREFRLWDGRFSLVRMVDGFPTWSFRCAPTGLATRRQLRARGLCPGGHQPYGLLVWRNGRQWAHLYRVDLARPKRVPTDSQRAALAKATAAAVASRAAVRYCPACDADAGYPLTRFGGLCFEHRAEVSGRSV